MAHNFKEGIDWATDPTGNTPLSGRRFISKSGNDANDGTDPDNPKLTIASAFATYTGSWIIGSGIYNESPTIGNIRGDGIVEMVGTALVDWGQNTSSPRSTGYLRFSDYRRVYPVGGSGTCEGNLFRNIIDLVDLTRGSIIADCKFVNALGDRSKANLVRNAHFNSDLSILATANKTQGCYFHTDCLLDLPTTAEALLIEDCIIRGPVEINGVAYTDIQDARDTLGNQNLFPGCLNIDPLFLGNPFELEFTVATNSPALGMGPGGTNVGNFKSGVIQNSDSNEFTTGAIANNTAFNSGALELTSGTSSYRETDTIDLGRTTKSPTLTLNGVSDYINNVIDSDNVNTNPNHLTYDAQWAGKDGVFNGTWKTFRFDHPMSIDGAGKSNGESGYNWNQIEQLTVRYLKIRIYVRDDYNEG